MKNKLIIAISAVLIVALLGVVVYIAILPTLNKGNEDTQPETAPTFATVDKQVETISTETYKVGIVQNGMGNASKDCYEGFITELNNRGMLNNLEITYIVEDDKEQCRTKIQQLVDNGCDLLYTIGRYATETAADITSDIPIVFGAVNSPDEIGLVDSNEVPGGNVTGVSSYTPCFEQIDLIPLLLPEKKTLAIIYNDTDETAVSQGLVAAREAELNEISCEKYEISDKKTLESALKKIKEAGTEILYVPVDEFLTANITTILDFSNENKIPVICGDLATLERGAFATSEINYKSIGNKAAGMVYDILFDNKKPAEISVMYKHDCTNYVNKAVADKLGIKIPATALGDIEYWEAATEDPSSASAVTPATEAPVIVTEAPKETKSETKAE